MSLPSTITAIVNYPPQIVVRLIQKGDPGEITYAAISGTGPGQGAEMVGYLAPFTGAVATTQSQVNTESISVFRWFTADQIADVQAGTLQVDVTTPIQQAVNAMLLRGGTLWFPHGFYLISGTIHVGASIYTPAQFSTMIRRTADMGGLNFSGTCSFNANQMTVVTTTYGVPRVGDIITAAGVSAGTTILSGTGPFTLSTSPGTIGAEACTATTPGLAPDSANQTYNQNNYQSISFDFDTNAVLVAATAWVPPATAPAAMLEYNLTGSFGSAFIRGLTCISQASMSGTRYMPGNASAAPVDNLIGLAYTREGLNSIDTVDFTGLGTGILAVAPYWTTLSNLHAQYCGDCVNWINGNASTISNLRMTYSTRGLIVDGDAMSVSGVHTEQVLNDFVVYESNSSSFKDMYLEDVLGTSGSGASSVTLGNGAPQKIVISKFESIYVGSARPGKNGWNISSGFSSSTLETCRALATPVVVATNARGIASQCDNSINLQLSPPNWTISSGCSFWLTENPPGSQRTAVGRWFFFYSATLSTINSGSQTQSVIPCSIWPPFQYASVVITPQYAGNYQISYFGKMVNQATFYGYIVGTTLTVTSVVSGSLAVGQKMSFAGMSAPDVSIAVGSGGVGIYTLSSSLGNVGSASAPILMYNQAIYLIFQNNTASAITTPSVYLGVEVTPWV
jgi:hypothetical protein